MAYCAVVRIYLFLCVRVPGTGAGQQSIYTHMDREIMAVAAIEKGQ